MHRSAWDNILRILRQLVPPEPAPVIADPTRSPLTVDQPRVALMIDGENISSALFLDILRIALLYGDLRVRRVYGAMGIASNIQAWQLLAPRYGLDLCHVPRSTNKKNGTDIALVVDTMLLLAAQAFDVLCLVADDSDYVPLIQAVHAANLRVVGIGANQSATALSYACTDFHLLTSTTHLESALAVKPAAPAPPAPPTPKPAPPAPPAAPAPPALPAPPTPKPAPPAPSIHTYTALEALLIKAWLAGKKSADGWMDLPTLGSALRQVEPSFTSSSHGHSTLTKLVQAHTRILEIQGTQNKLLIRRRILSRMPDK